MRMLLLAMIIFLAAGIGLAQGQSIIESETDPKLKSAMNNWHHEMVECYTFYLLSEVAFERKGEPDLVRKMQDLQAILEKRMLALHIADTTMARMELSAKYMSEKIRQNFANYSILLNEYAELCAEVIDNSDARFEYWLALEQ